MCSSGLSLTYFITIGDGGCGDENVHRVFDHGWGLNMKTAMVTYIE